MGILVGCGLVAAVHGSVAAQDVGAVRGTVFDSVSSSPLSGAEVFIWDTNLRTVTDENGVFTLDSVPVGAQRLIFVHPLLLELGVSTGRAEVLVPAEGHAEAAMATPSPFTILRNMCLLEGGSPDSGVVVGQVGDVASQVPIPGARVQLSWQDGLGSPHATESVSDSRGWFRFCDVPADVDLAATVHFLNQSSIRRLLHLDGGTEGWVPFLVGDLEPGSLTGTLRDQDRGWGIEDAEVSLVGTRHRAVSGPGGSFRFSSVPPGEYTLQ
ncbi:MAG: carboxypeptidase regulatory-like domain-containing protein, partial [Gemmatimonadota bacterium]|nr:carboxypeptidase regulatory-like domain-containing protein [Gemmatimonadota bacterium]